MNDLTCVYPCGLKHESYVGIISLDGTVFYSDTGVVKGSNNWRTLQLWHYVQYHIENREFVVLINEPHV